MKDFVTGLNCGNDIFPDLQKITPTPGDPNDKTQSEIPSENQIKVSTFGAPAVNSES